MDYTKSGSRIEDNYRMYSGLNYKGKCEYCGIYSEVDTHSVNIVLKDVRMTHTWNEERRNMMKN